eukprot:scaffold235615_cov19-Prasinocladus_malaysianus.AAC.1
MHTAGSSLLLCNSYHSFLSASRPKLNVGMQQQDNLVSDPDDRLSLLTDRARGVLMPWPSQ